MEVDTGCAAVAGADGPATLRNWACGAGAAAALPRALSAARAEPASLSAAQNEVKIDV